MLSIEFARISKNFIERKRMARSLAVYYFFAN